MSSNNNDDNSNLVKFLMLYAIFTKFLDKRDLPLEHRRKRKSTQLKCSGVGIRGNEMSVLVSLLVFDDIISLLLSIQHSFTIYVSIIELLDRTFTRCK